MVVFLCFSMGVGIFALGLIRGSSRADFVERFDGDPVEQALWFGMYAFSVCRLLTLPRDWLRKTFRFGLIWLLLGVAILSIFWSELPAVTLRRTFALLGTTAVGMYFAARFTWSELWRLLLWAMAIAAVSSLAVAVAVPSYGRYTEATDDPWTGLFVTKNALGHMMALSAMAWLLEFLQARTYRILQAAFVALSVALLGLSTSMTGLVVLVTLLVVLPLSRLFRWQYKYGLAALMVAATVVGGIAASWVAIELDPMLDILGRDVTFTGRTELWEVTWELVQESFWLGYGYGGFWHGWDGPSRDVWLAIYWHPPHAHNGFLDLWLHLGFVGVLLFVLSFSSNLFRALALIRSEPAIAASFPVAFLVFVLLSNITENNLLTHNWLTWILYMVVSIKLQPSGEEAGTWRPTLSSDADSIPAHTQAGDLRTGPAPMEASAMHAAAVPPNWC